MACFEFARTAMNSVPLTDLHADLPGGIQRQQWILRYQGNAVSANGTYLRLVKRHEVAAVKFDSSVRNATVPR
jgi:hypothetical protein